MKQKGKLSAPALLAAALMMLAVPVGAEPVSEAAAEQTAETVQTETVPAAEQTGSGNVAVMPPVQAYDADGDGQITIHDALQQANADIGSGQTPANVYIYFVQPTETQPVQTQPPQTVPTAVQTAPPQTASPQTVPAAQGAGAGSFSYKGYSAFDKTSVTVKAGTPFTLVLKQTILDENNRFVTMPVAGAVVTLNGAPTQFSTDENGSVTITLTQPGSWSLSAVSDASNTVPPTTRVLVLSDIAGQIADAVATGIAGQSGTTQTTVAGWITADVYTNTTTSYTDYSVTSTSLPTGMTYASGSYPTAGSLATGEHDGIFAVIGIFAIAALGAVGLFVRKREKPVRA